jgi:hypothetical protein
MSARCWTPEQRERLIEALHARAMRTLDAQLLASVNRMRMRTQTERIREHFRGLDQLSGERLDEAADLAGVARGPIDDAIVYFERKIAAACAMPAEILFGGSK